ncbi:hypothetical protein Hypma_016196 [Hypsizygus marmoreus]|uniref:Uncharacterized protein n=1 Tax=Hypsizygus marmoreus TaxID=39966 RepID=A0A369IYX2_HYPMA|nr:hypothetical protein Hypma_016196 [Hypsizygus marmoreus]
MRSELYLGRKGNDTFSTYLEKCLSLNIQKMIVPDGGADMQHTSKMAKLNHEVESILPGEYTACAWIPDRFFSAFSFESRRESTTRFSVWKICPGYARNPQADDNLPSGTTPFRPGLSLIGNAHYDNHASHIPQTGPLREKSAGFGASRAWGIDCRRRTKKKLTSHEPTRPGHPAVWKGPVLTKKQVIQPKLKDQNQAIKRKEKEI